jgi:hypothetical protein
MVKDLVLGEIEDKLKGLDDSWVQRWVDNEVSIFDEFIKPNESLINSCKGMPLDSIESITFRDLQDTCIRAKPFIQDKWVTDQATKKMNEELANIKNFILDIE